MHKKSTHDALRERNSPGYNCFGAHPIKLHGSIKTSRKAVSSFIKSVIVFLALLSLFFSHDNNELKQKEYL